MAKWILLVLITFLNHSLLAQVNLNLKEAFKSYKLGSYQNTIERLNQVSGNNTILGSKFYLQGLSHSRLKQFDEAIVSFKKALSYNNSAKDLNYEYAQALYAASELEQSRKKFHQSYKRKYKTAVSLYYMGNISQLLEEHAKAHKYFENILKVEKEDKKLRQVARLQMAESTLALAEGKSSIARIVEKKVIPELDKAIKVDKSSDVAFDIERRKEQLKDKYGLNPHKLKNGRNLSKKKLTVYFSQKLSYDSNISLSTDLPSTQRTSSADSYILTTSGFVKYRLVTKQRWTHSPELRLTNNHHTDRDNSAVFQNDSRTIAPAFRNTYEFQINKKPAAFLFDVEYNYTQRDRDLTESKIFYGRTIGGLIGLKMKAWGGELTGKLKKSDYTSYTPDNDTKTTTAQFTHVTVLPEKKLLILLMIGTFTDAYNVPNNSTDSFLFKIDYIKSDFVPNYSINPSFTLTMLDTKLQKLTRGTEKTYTPGIKFTKQSGKNLKLLLSYNYEKKTSLDEGSFAYTKHVGSFELKYTF
jgi:tetratricopeptide (TPR) repeat protein